MTSIIRGDPPGLKNVRKAIYHHYIRIDNTGSLTFLSGRLARDVMIEFQAIAVIR